MTDVKIETEILITLVAALVTTLIFIFQLQRNALRRLRLRHDLELLALAKGANYDIKHHEGLTKREFYVNENRRLIDFGLLWWAIFWIAVFIGFASWTLFLARQGMNPWVVFSGLFALLGLVMSFAVWTENSYRREEIERLIRGIDVYEPTIAREGTAAEARVQRLVPAEAEVKPAVAIEGRVEVPEDSALRRHFFTQLRADIESSLPPRPTDSTLRRHHDAMIDAKVEQRISGTISEAAVQPVSEAVLKPVVVSKAPASPVPPRVEGIPLAIPEDSTLRRHFFNELREQIESTMPPRPTDSALRRHYDAMVEAEMENRLAKAQS